MKYSISSIPVLGNANRDTLVVQQALNDQGAKIKADGVFGPKTAKAISEFQKSKGLTGSGVIGPKTLAFLLVAILAVSPITGAKAITQDLKGRQDRHLHPSMRILIEGVIFPDGKVPDFIKAGDVQKSYSYVMEKMAGLGIMEHGANNHGREVGYIQGVTGSYIDNGNGDAWCLDWGQCGIAILEDFWQQESPVIGSAHCMTAFRAAKKVEGLVSTSAEDGTLALAKNGDTDSGHAMPVVKLLPKGKMQTSEGNTSVGNMRDGDGSGLKERNQKTNGDLVTQGFVRLYPYNKLPKELTHV